MQNPNSALLQSMNDIQYAFAQYVVRRDDISHANVKACIEKARELVAESPAPVASAEEALYTMDQMREYADNFHLSRMRVLVAEKEAYERHAPKPEPEPEPYGYAPMHENGNYFTRNKSTADYVGGMMLVYAAAQPSKAEVLEEAAQWQWRWIGDTDDAWRNSTQAECERIASFAPEKQHWEVRVLYAHPAAIRSQGRP